MNKKEVRYRRAAKTRAKISELMKPRLSVFRSNLHIYAQLFSACGSRVLVSASTLDREIKGLLLKSSNVAAAKVVGKFIGERCVSRGIFEVAFDRSGFKYHGRVKALADGAREAGLRF